MLLNEYKAMHARLRTVRGRARDFACVDCGRSAYQWSYVGGCPDELLDKFPYCPHTEHYAPRCTPCHWQYDSTAKTMPPRLVGSTNHRARLTEDQVRTIRKRYAAGARQIDLAIEYGIHQTHISRIVLRKTWEHIE